MIKGRLQSVFESFFCSSDVFFLFVGSQVPQLDLDNTNRSLVLLRKEYAWIIGGALAQHELDEWKLLYHSAIHGQSFNTFLGKTS